MTPWQLGVVDAAGRMRSGELSPVDFLDSCLARIGSTERLVEAWEFIDVVGARRFAAELDQIPAAQRSGALFGIPVGIKDVIDVRGMPTRAGFAPFRDKVAARDAAAVAALRRNGANVIGKTVTAQFAWSQDPPKTRNPWNSSRTPGASSSGTAAAVAARHVPLAIGTQTTSSLLRPASYCGVVGFKPTYGRVSCAGVFPTSWSSDHVGATARSVADVSLLLEPDGSALERPCRRDPPNVAVVTELAARCSAAVSAAFDSVIECLRNAGATITEISLPFAFELMLAVHWAIHNSEAAAIHLDRFRQHRDDYLPTVRRNVESSMLIPAAAYVHAKRWRRKLSAHVRAMLADFDAVLAPTSSDQPPLINSNAREGRMGDTSLQILASLFGLPAVSVPATLDCDGLPFGIQLIGSAGQDLPLLEVARWCEARFAPMPYPELDVPDSNLAVDLEARLW